MNRPTIILLASVMVLLGGLVSVGAVTQLRDEALRGISNAATESDLPFRIPRFGVNADLTLYDITALNAQLAHMKLAHVRWIRQFFRWDRIVPVSGDWNWEDYDRVVNALRDETDIGIVAVLFGTPEWARDPRSKYDATTPPTSPEAFAEFARAFALRYGDIVDVYQVWDEPNLESAWGGLPPQPVDYLALLSGASQAIRSVDSKATILAAALAPTVENNAHNISDISFLEALYNLGGAEAFDAAAAKPYGFNTSSEDRSVSEDQLNFSRIITLREVMVRHGDQHKALWASAWGWNSLPPDWSGSPSIWGSVTSDEQITYTLSAMMRADVEWAWLGGMILHLWQPSAPCDDPQWGFALIACDGSPSALYQALVSVNPNSLPRNGVFFPTHESATYSGVWTFSPLGADIGWIQDSRVTFEFEGSDVSLLVRKDNYSAYLYVSIDGQPANALPHDSTGTAYLSLTSGTHEPETRMIPVGVNLGDGVHRLEVIADRGWDRWALAGFGVSSGDRAAPYQRQITVAGVTALVGALATVISIFRINWAALFQRLSVLVNLISAAGQLVLSAAASIAVMIGLLMTWADATPAIFRKEPVQLILAVLTAGIIYLQPHIFLLVGSAIVLFVMLYRKPQHGLVLTVFYAPFFLFPVKLYLFAFPMAEFLILLTAAASALRAFASWGNQWRAGKRQVVMRIQSPDSALVVWLLLGCLSLLWADVPGKALTELRVLFVEPIVFYLLVRIHCRDRMNLPRLVDAMILAALIVSIIGIYQFFSGSGVITAEAGVQRLSSVYGSPNNVALFLGRCIPFALAFSLVTLDSRRRVVSGIALVTMLTTVVLTQSAGGIFLGLPAAIILVAFLTLRRRAIPLLAGLVALGALAVPLLLRSARFSRLLDFSQGTNFFRLRVWESALDMISDHPILGIGLDQFLYAYRGIYLRPDSWQEPDLSHPHNFVLDIWLRLGIFGLLLFAFIQIHFWRAGLSLYSKLRGHDPLLFALIVGAMGSMINLLVHGIVDNSVFVQDLSYVFVLLLAIISNVRAIDARHETVV